MSNNDKDRLYAERKQQIERFRFDANVARVFPDMINRSVPGYSTIINMVGLLSGRFAQNGSNCYDLGCSLGAGSLVIAEAVKDKNCTVFAIDSSTAMLQRFRETLGDSIDNLSLVCKDVRDVDYSDATFVLLNFTLQFLPPDHRLPLLRKIRNGMRPGACIVLSEKIAFENELEQQFQEQNHIAFKMANGYSELEVSQKRAALEEVLLAETEITHLSRLHQAGFSHSYKWFQCFNFASFVAFND